jgi:hypothetical protein
LFYRLGVDILEGYIALDAETQARNISAWTPVVAEVLQGICSWEDEVLQEHVAIIYPLAVDLLAREMTAEIRESVRSGESPYLFQIPVNTAHLLPQLVFHRVGLALHVFTVTEGSANGSEASEHEDLTAEEA